MILHYKATSRKPRQRSS